MSTTDSTNNKPAGPGGGLQKIDRQAALASLRQPVGDVVDMHELAPVMASFREHMAQEQERNRRRLRAVVLGFLAALCVLLIVPIYVARMYVKNSETHLKTQREAQEKLTQSLESGMASLAAQSELLQTELAKQRVLLAAAATSAPPAAPAAPTIIVVTTLVPVAVAAPVSAAIPQQQPSQVSPITMRPLPQSIGLTVQPVTPVTPANVSQPPVALPSSEKIAGLKIAELKSMLDEIEQAIQSKRRELQALRALQNQ